MRAERTNTSGLVFSLFSAFIFFVACLAVSRSANAAAYYWSGDQSSGGSVSNPISGNWSSSTTANWYQDAGGTTTYGVDVNPANSDATDLYLGGVAGSSAYTVSGNSAIDINGIYLEAVTTATDVLNFTLTGSNKVSFGTGGASGTAGPVIQQDGSTNWMITNTGGATAPIRMNNSMSVTGAGTGNVDIAAEIANVSSAKNFSVDETGGATIILSAANVFGGTGESFTLTAGNLDFQNNQALGVLTNSVNLNGGSIMSSTGNTLSTYTAVNIGGSVAFGGAVPWSLGASPVSLAATQTITANTGGTTGATIAGAITGVGGLNIGSGSTGILSVTNTGDAYGGPTSVNGGTLLVNGNITTSLVTVTSPGILGGTGTLGALATINGTVAPGATAGTIGTLNFLGGLTIGGTYSDDVDNAGASDVLAVTGNLDLMASSILNVNVLDSLSGSTYTIATYTGTLTGTFDPSSLPNGYSINYGTGTDSSITLVVAVPEPGSLALLCVAGAGMLRRRRRAA
jgi:hypothetical protein